MLSPLVKTWSACRGSPHPASWAVGNLLGAGGLMVWGPGQYLGSLLTGILERVVWGAGQAVFTLCHPARAFAEHACSGDHVSRVARTPYPSLLVGTEASHLSVFPG